MQEKTEVFPRKKLGFYQRIIFALLKQIRFGKIIVKQGAHSWEFVGQEKTDTHIVMVEVFDHRIYKSILFQGSIAAGETYMQQGWSTSDLPMLLEIMLLNERVLTKLDGHFYRISSFIKRLTAAFNKNVLAQAKKNISAHYDLGNDFFEHILDPSMMYSCAIYSSPEQPQLHASINKLDTICKALKLTENDKVLEIGTGWGGFALHAVKHYGCHITTTTISEKQHAHVEKQIQDHGYGNKIELLKTDYRLLTGQFDKIVSIEMIEAIGHQHIDNYFEACARLLRNNGLFLLQAITINDRIYERAKNEIDFIKKHIFPGGCLPSIGSISRSIAKQADMRLVTMNDIGSHYVKTLSDWLDRMRQNKNSIIALGYSAELIRQWEYYFSYCMAGFKSGYISDIHAIWQKRELAC